MSRPSATRCKGHGPYLIVSFHRFFSPLASQDTHLFCFALFCGCLSLPISGDVPPLQCACTPGVSSECRANSTCVLSSPDSYCLRLERRSRSALDESSLLLLACTQDHGSCLQHGAVCCRTGDLCNRSPLPVRTAGSEYEKPPRFLEGKTLYNVACYSRGEVIGLSFHWLERDRRSSSAFVRQSRFLAYTMLPGGIGSAKLSLRTHAGRCVFWCEMENN